MARKSSGSIVLTILAALFFFSGLGAVFYWGIPTIRTAKASESWPTVSGVVKESTVVEKTRSKSSSRSSRSKRLSNRKETTTTFQPEVCYKYMVDGETHFSSRLQAGVTVSYGSSATAYEVANKYPKGSTVEVYYDPNSPSESVLEPGLTFSSYVPLILGCVFSFIGFLMGLIPGFRFLIAIFTVGLAMSSEKIGTSKSEFTQSLPMAKPR